AVISRMREKQVEDPRADRLELLERRHRLGSAGGNGNFAAGSLLDQFREGFSNSRNGWVRIVPARNQAKLLSIHRSCRQEPRSRRNQRAQPSATTQFVHTHIPLPISLTAWKSARFATPIHAGAFLD